MATLRGAVSLEKAPYGPPKVRVTFTIGEPGKPPGTGITFGSDIQMLLLDKAGRAVMPMIARADCRNGRCTATTILPAGGIGAVRVGAWLNYPTGPPTAKYGYWIPVKIDANNA